MVSSMDIFHTITKLAELPPQNGKADLGINLLPYITGEKSSYPHKYLIWQRGFSKAIRSNDWKLSINENFEDTLLFNIAKDPFKTKNVQANHREIV